MFASFLHIFRFTIHLMAYCHIYSLPSNMFQQVSTFVICQHSSTHCPTVVWHTFICDKSGAEGWATIYSIYIYNFLYHSLHVLDGGAHALKGYACMIVRSMQSDRVPSSGNKIYIIYYIVLYIIYMLYIYIYVVRVLYIRVRETRTGYCFFWACWFRVWTNPWLHLLVLDPH